MISIILTIIMMLTVTVSIIVIRNLLLKIERLEDELNNVATDLAMKDEFIISLLEKTKAAHDQMKQVDYMGSFEADDEVGSIFKNIKQVVDQLNDYIKQNIINYANDDSGTKA